MGLLKSRKTPMALLTLGALGVVYGDIGTSPLYAVNEVFFGPANTPITPQHALGTASLIFWVLLFIIGVKYALLVLRADHKGEGGIFALFSLFRQFHGRRMTTVALLLMFAAGLLLGDGIITPAISVLSAVEGLKVSWPELNHLVVPITVLIILAVFFFQKKGTQKTGRLYGPVMLLWFICIGWLGMRQLLVRPDMILQVLNPLTAVRLMGSVSPHMVLLLISAVFLVVTGGEALYADMGHFGRRAIRWGWILVVFPALILNYAGQGAYLASGQAVKGQNIFYSLVPAHWVLPLVILATAATVIASVAMIVGAYSIVSHAIALKILPRVNIRHTNQATESQIYIPFVNWLLCAGSVLLVVIFHSSSNLAAAYGFAVSGVMLITSIAMMTITHRYWRWPRVVSLAVFGTFAGVDMVFFIANSAKFLHGGFIPCTIGIVTFVVIYSWRWGRRIMRSAYDAFVEDRSMQWFIDLKHQVAAHGFATSDEHDHRIVEEDRAVIFLTSRPIVDHSSRIPVKLRIYLKRHGSIPKEIIFLHISQTREPYIHEHKYETLDLGENVLVVNARFGFMEQPRVAGLLHDFYEQKLVEKQFERCSVEVSEDEFIIDGDLPLTTKLKAHLLRLLSRYTLPRYQYFGFKGGASVGLSKTVVPIHLSLEGIRVEIPEFILGGESAQLSDFSPNKTPYTRF